MAIDTELFFNLASRGYDLLTAQDVWREQVVRVLEHVPSTGDIARILDLGCGPGVSAFVLAEKFPRAEVVGIDLAENMIRRAHRHHRRSFSQLDNVDFRVADAADTGFDDGAFDLAVGHSFLYLIPDQQGVLQEVRRVLAPGGTLVLMEPNRQGSLRHAVARNFDCEYAHAGTVDAARFQLSMVLWRLVSGNVGRLEPGQVVAWMQEAGFDQAEVHPTLGGLGMHCVGRVQR